MCTVLLPPGDNSIAVNKYTKIYIKTRQSVPLTQSDKPTLTALEYIRLHLSYPYTKLKILYIKLSTKDSDPNCRRHSLNSARW